MDDLNIVKGSVKNLPTGDDIIIGTLYFCTDSLEIYEGYLDTTVEPNEKKLRQYNGPKILVETGEGTTMPVLDSCVTEGQYTYIIRGGTRCTLIVNTYTVHVAEENFDLTVVNQTLIVPVDATETFSQPGIYTRYTIINSNENNITWEDFRRSITDFEIAPPPGTPGHFLESGKDYGSKWVKGSLVPDFKDIIAKSKLVVENNALKWEEDKGSELPIIQETEGTTVLDTCKTEGEYIYISPSGVHNRLIVSVQVIENYDDSGLPAYIYTQFILASIDLFADESTFGIYYRIGIDFDGESVWEEFTKSLTSYDFEDLIPTPSERGLIAISDDKSDRGHIIRWARGKLLPTYTDSSKKLKLVAKDNEEYWEEDIPIMVEIYDTNGTTTNLDACVKTGYYTYINSTYDVFGTLIVSRYSTMTGQTVIQLLICNEQYQADVQSIIEPFRVGIQWRTGYVSRNGDEITWDEFKYVMNEDSDISGSSIPEIYETEGTTLLDSCLTEGEYIYIYPDGMRCRLIVAAYEAEYYGIQAKSVSQMLIKLNEPVNNTIPGVYFRNGYDIGEGFIWDNEFSRYITENEIYTLIPEHSGHGLVLTTDSSSNRKYKWVEPRYVPKFENIINKSKLVTKDGNLEWEEDKGYELPVIQETEGTTVLDTIITEGSYRYITQNGTRCILNVAVSSDELDISGEGDITILALVIQTLTVYDLYGEYECGIYTRYGEVLPEYNEYYWSEFGRLFDAETIEDIIPNTDVDGLILSSTPNSDKGKKYTWVRPRFVPNKPSDLYSKKTKLVSRADSDEYEWEDDSIATIPMITDNYGTTYLNCCVESGHYRYVNTSYDVCGTLIVSSNYAMNPNPTITQLLICTDFIKGNTVNIKEPFREGIQWRTGVHNITTNTVDWGEFKYVMDEDSDISGSSIPEIYETEGTAVLDTCMTEGIYNYISPTGVQHKLIVSVYSADDVDGEGNSGTLIYQTIIATPDFFGDIEERGIYQRYGTYYMGEYSWSEFEKSLTEDELSSIIRIPDCDQKGYVYVSKGTGNEGWWSNRELLPNLPSGNSQIPNKVKLVATKDTDGVYRNSSIKWEEDKGSEPPVIQETEGTTLLDSCLTEGEYIYIYPDGMRCRLIVAAYEAEYYGIQAKSVSQVLIKLNEPVNNTVPGVYFRNGYDIGEGFTWDNDFSKLVTENDINEIIPSVTYKDNGSVLTVQNGRVIWKEPSSTALSFIITLNMWISYGDNTNIPRKYICPIQVANLPHSISNEDTIILSSDDDEYSLYDIYCEDPISDYSGWGDALKFIATSPDGTIPSNNITVKVVKL